MRDAEDYERLKTLIAELPVAVYLMIGNHDDRQKFAKAFPELICANGFVKYAYPLSIGRGTFMKDNTCLIGIDLGSSSIKATIFDVGGNALGEASKDNHPHQPKAGVAEYEGDAMVACTMECIRDLLDAAGLKGDQVAGLCMDGMISGTIGADARGEATTPYTTPLDMQFAKQLNFVTDHHQEVIRTLTGSGGGSPSAE